MSTCDRCGGRVSGLEAWAGRCQECVKFLPLSLSVGTKLTKTAKAEPGRQWIQSIGRSMCPRCSKNALTCPCTSSQVADNLIARMSKSIDEAVADVQRESNADVTAPTVEIACGIKVTSDDRVPLGEMWCVQIDHKQIATAAGYKEDDIAAFGVDRSQSVPDWARCYEGIEWEPPKPVDPLDVEYDGVKLRDLIDNDEIRRQDGVHFGPRFSRFTPAQRAAMSAHWSAQLRAKVAASKAKERNKVTYCEED